MATKTLSSTLATARSRGRSRPMEFNALHGQDPTSGRVTLDLNAETIANLDALKQIHGKVTNTDAVRQALRHHRETLEAVNGPEVEKVESPLKNATLSKTASLAKNRKEIITYSTVLIEALQEAIDYNPSRQHNQETPPLFVDNQKYLSDISALTKELRKLNKLLEGTTKDIAKNKSAKTVADYIHLYFANYIPTLGKGSAYLTLGVMAALLHNLGFDNAIAAAVMSKLPK